MGAIDDLFWNASIEELKQGYSHDEKSEAYTCLICGERFIKGIIYPHNNLLLEAEKAARLHITEEHGSIFEYLLNMNKRYTGLTDVQKEILAYFHKGLTDKEIVEGQGGGSTSTIRNHRFKLKEKEKQAKVFLAIMELLNSEKDKENIDEREFMNIHRGATMMDDRYAITEEEREKVLKNYLKDGKLTNFPSKEKKKIVVLKYIMESFEANREYEEKEVNEIIKNIYEDFVTIRRYLIEYGFMDRKKDCSSYWVKL